MDRWSKWNLGKYQMERDNMRVKEGRERVWMRANAALCTKYLWRNGGEEDYATMIRLAYDKRWGTSIHNGEVCKACGGPAMGRSTPYSCVKMQR